MLTEENYRNIYKKLQEEHPENTEAFIALQDELIEKQIQTDILSFKDITENTALSAETKYKLMLNIIGDRVNVVYIEDFIKSIKNDNYTTFFALVNLVTEVDNVYVSQKYKHTISDKEIFLVLLNELNKKVERETEMSEDLDEEAIYKKNIDYYKVLFQHLDKDTKEPEVFSPAITYRGLNSYITRNSALRNDEAYKSVEKQFRKLNDHNKQIKIFIREHLSKKYSPSAYTKYALYEHEIDFINIDEEIITLLMKLSSKVPAERFERVIDEVDSVDLNTRVENKEIDTKLDLNEWFYHTFFSGMGLASIVKDNNITMDDVSFDYIKGEKGFIQRAMELVGVSDPKDLEGKTIGEIVAKYQTSLTPETLNIQPYQGPITFTGTLRQYAILTDNKAVLDILDTKGVIHDFTSHPYNDIRGYGNTFNTRSYLIEQSSKESKNEEETFYHNLLGRHNKVLTKRNINKIIKGSN